MSPTFDLRQLPPSSYSPLWHGAAQQNSTDAVQTSDTVHDAPVAAAAAAYA